MDEYNNNEVTMNAQKRSYLMAREPSIDRRFRPRPSKKRQRLFEDIQESESGSEENEETEEDEEEEQEEVCSYTTGEAEEFSSTAEAEGSGNGPQVFLRLRPCEVASKLYMISECGKVLITGAAVCENSRSAMEKHYSFTRVFDSFVEQHDVYDSCVGPKIQEEESLSVMAYGTSGSGKTYTLLGDDVHAGIIPRALDHIFTLYTHNLYIKAQLKLENARMTILTDEAALKEMKIRRQVLALCPEIGAHYQRFKELIDSNHNFMPKTMEDVSVMIWVSFAEIYNECVYDLLAIPHRTAKMAEPPRKNLKIVCNNGQVFIKGLSSIFVKNSAEALQLLRFGQQHLTYASTAVNSNSSRSHCIFFVDILKFHRSGVTTQTSYKFCDLAGSERVDKTGTVGSRLKEAMRINTSLMVLGRCLDAASSGQSRKKNNHEVIPFRESKLTMLLQPALQGRERLAMIVTVAPLEKYYEENLNVLNFSSIAKDIIFKEPLIKQHNTRYSAFPDSIQSRSLDREEVEQLEAENLRLRSTIDQMKMENILKLQLQEERLRRDLTENFKKNIEANQKFWEDSTEKKLQMLRRELEATFDVERRQLKAEIEDLKEDLAELKGEGNSSVELIEDE